MTAVLYTPHFVQFFDNDGDPLVGGLLYFAYNSLHGDLNMCIANWNTTSNAYQMLLNQSKVVIQNNTLII